jgi:glycosyltransferase involved in cell wall biosynthesis
MIKVLHVTHSLGTGGAELLLVDLARLMDKDRFQLGVCCTGRDGRTRAALEETGTEVTVLDRPRRSSVQFPLFLTDVLSLWSGIRRVIGRFRPDVVHTHLESNYIGPFVAKRCGVKAVVSSFHSSVYVAPRGKWSVRNRTRRAVLRKLGRTADALVAGSKYAADVAAQVCGVPASSVHIIHNAVDVTRLSRITPHLAVRAELGLPDDEVLLVTLGTVKEAKNHQLLLRAMRLVAQTRSNVSALIIGGGSSEFIDQLRALAKQLGVDEKVHFLGFREDAYAVVKACDLFVLPSLWEGLPLAALEAMACGTPVLTSDIPPHRELIDHDVDGWLFRSGDEVDLTQKIIGALDDAELRRSMAAAGPGKVSAGYDSPLMARRFAEIYEACLAPETR